MMRFSSTQTLLLFGWLALLPSCTGYDMSDKEPCDDAGYGISARVFDCTKSDKKANAAYKLFDSTYKCDLGALQSIRQNEGVGAMFNCSRRLNELTCDEINAAGDITVDVIDTWVQARPECQAILVR